MASPTIPIKDRPWDAIVIGAGAAGLMTAIVAAKRGRRVLVLDHARKPAEKIRISGGGRCNFTNLHCSEKHFLSSNPRFCISALRGFTPTDFLKLVETHRINWHEKTLGQLFCDDSAQQIIDMLLDELDRAGGVLQLATEIKGVNGKASSIIWRPAGVQSRRPLWWWQQGANPFRRSERRGWAMRLPGSSAFRFCPPAPGWCH